MMQDNRIIGGGIADLMGHGDVYIPGAFDFAQKSEPVVRMAGGGFLDDEMLLEDFGLPIGNSYAAPPPPPVVPIAAQAPAVVGAPMAAPAPSPVVSPFNQGLSQDQSFDDLMSYVMSGQPTMKAVSAPAPISSSVPAYAPAPSPVYTPALSPANLFGLDTAPEFDPTVGLPAFTSAPAPSPVQAPAPTPAAQAPATPTKYGYWKTVDYGGMGGEGGGQGYSQAEWVSTPDLASQYENVANYKPYEGSIDPKAFSWAKPAQSGADIYGIWNFDTKSGRETASEEYARSVANPIVVNPETGESYTPSAPVVSNPFTTTDKEGNATLDPSYGLKDVSGLVHGTMQAPEKDGKHITTYSAFFDPKTGKQVGNYATRTVEIPKTNWIENLVTNALFALPALTIPGFGAGAALMSGAKSASEGNVLGALSGLAGGIGSLPGIDPSTVSTVRSVGDVASKISALTSGDPLQQLGALAGITGSEELATASKAANTAALLNAAASGNPNAVMKLVTTLGPSAVDLLTGGPGAMTAGEADERKGVSEVTDLINNLAFAPTPSPAPAAAAPAPSPAPEPPPPAPAPEPAPAPAPSVDTGEEETESEEDKEGTEAAIDALTKGADTAAGVSGEDLTAGASDQTVQDLLDAGLTSADTGVDSLINELTGNTPSNLSEQAKFLESNVEDAGDIDQLLKDYAIDTGQLQGDYAGVGNLGQDFVVTETGDIKDTAGNYGNFDPATGEWTPYTEQLGVSDDLQTVDVVGKKLDDLEDYGLTDREIEDRDAVKRIIDDFGYTAGGGGTGGGTGGSKTGGGGTPTKTTTPTTPTAAQSGLDFESLLALMAMTGGGQQEPQEQIAYGQMPIRSAEEIFGLKEPTTLADILRRRA